MTRPREIVDGTEGRHRNAKELTGIVREAYFAALPRMALSRCPFTGRLLRRCFDPWGLDGLWWQTDVFKLAQWEEPPAPETYQLLRGAVQLNGRPLKGGKKVSRIGPDAPYVIERILDKPTMIAVIASVEMSSGATAYPIAYFARSRSRRARWPRAGAK